jgi:cell wall-associated NlpC family hydrolase
MSVAEERAAVVAEARSWLFTPFRKGQAIKGAGVDCAGLLAETYNVAIGTQLKVREYDEQWHLHRTEELYIEDLTKAGFIEVSAELRGDGDIALSKMGRVYCHGAIILGWPKVIHAEGSGNAVIIVNTKADFYFQYRQVKFFSWGAWHARA